jgi:hypothetical protein
LSAVFFVVIAPYAGIVSEVPVALRVSAFLRQLRLHTLV